MNKRIIYPNETSVSIIIPSDNCGLPLEDIARKDVPSGVPYLIVDVSDIPTDREFRDAWEADFTTPDGYGIGADAWFAYQEQNEVQE